LPQRLPTDGAVLSADGGEHAAAPHVTRLLDCTEIGQTSANFMLRGSDIHTRTCWICAEVCERCAQDCERMGDDAPSPAATGLRWPCNVVRRVWLTRQMLSSHG
jgi:hypothetical protein